MLMIVENIENADCMFLIEIADVLNIKELQLKYYKTTFTIKNVKKSMLGFKPATY